MEKILERLNIMTTRRTAWIVFALFLVNVVALNALDRPLLTLANGEPKLDLRFGYSAETVQMLFDAYGPEGRTIYTWNLLVDTPFPVLAGLSVILFVLLVIRNPTWQKVLLLAPVVFIITDLIENALLLVMIARFPPVNETFVSVTSLVTQVKRAAFYTSAVELLVALPASFFIKPESESAEPAHP